MTPTPATPVAAPSVSELRDMVSRDAPEYSHAPKEERTATIPETPVTEKPAAVQEPGPAHIQEPKETVETKDDQEAPLPEGVRKRVEKIAADTARIQTEIDRHISANKAAKAELAKLSDTGKSGSEPVKTTAPAKDSKPVKPQFADYGDGKTWADYQADTAKYEADHEAWLLSESDRRAEEKFAAHQRQADSDRLLSETEKKTPGFKASLAVLMEGAPEGLRVAISALDNWDGLIAHLGKAENKAELTALIGKFGTNPSAAIADLGKLEDRLSKTAPTTKPGKIELLPDPVSKDGGRSSVGANDVDLNKVGIARFKQEINKMRAKVG